MLLKMCKLTSYIILINFQKMYNLNRVIVIIFNYTHVYVCGYTLSWNSTAPINSLDKTWVDVISH